MKKPSVAIVGAGKVGSALAVLLHRRGYPIGGIASRSLASALRLAEKLCAPATNRPSDITSKAEVVFITTPDRVIRTVANQIYEQNGFKSGQTVFHTSGADLADEVGVARKAGAWAASLHPLQSFATVQMAMENLPGSYFALEGDAEAQPIAEQIVRDLEGRSFTIAAQDKPIYHASACIASNYLVSLIHLATGLYPRFGLSREESFQALLPLIRGTLNNIGQLGPTEALTGPIVRGDAPTLALHLDRLARIGSAELELYCQLGLYTVKIALEKKSITPEQGDELVDLLKSGINKQQ
jgi:predicted short-subunit dehydrogenase-like oxidoreductase (DUF2520 family)